MFINQDSDILILDIGERFFKFLVVSVSPNNTLEYTYAIQQPSAGIVNGEVVNLRQLSEQIFKSLYKVEIDSGLSFDKLYLCFSFGDLKVQSFSTTLQINGIVDNNHIEHIAKELEFFSEGFIVDYLDYGYYISNSKKQDPVGMFAQNMRYECEFVSCRQDLIVHLTLALKRINISILGIGLGNIKVMNKLLLEDCLLIDVGFSSSRIISRFDKNLHKIKVVNKGINDLLKSLVVRNGKSLDKIEEILSISYKVGNFHMVESTRLFFFNLFNELLQEIFQEIMTYDYTIWLYGACESIPLLDVFLKQKFDRDFRMLEIDCDINTQQNVNYFINSYAYVKDLVSTNNSIQNFLNANFVNLKNKIYSKL